MKSPRMQTVAISLISVMAFVRVSCAATVNRQPVRETNGAEAYSSFGVDLFREMLKERPGENIFISPASVGFALAMTSNGAAGETRDAMANVLRLTEKSPAFVNVVDSTFISKMNDTIRGVTLSVANSLWAREGVTFRKDFLTTNERYYGAEIQTLDFRSSEAPARINSWVAATTHNRITKIVDEIDESSILFLINAIYFEGTWTKEFDKNLTQEEPFHLANGTTSPRPMMRQSGKYAYLEGDAFQAVRLPYGDGRIGMYVFLPAEDSSLERFHAELTSEKLNTWMGRLQRLAGMIILPRFRLEYEARLKKALSALGMGAAFDCGRADFTRMVKLPGADACIHDVVHKTFVEVNEKGTEAAAVTSVDVRLTTVMEPEKPFEMIVDRPFFLAIVDGKTGIILFMGSIVNPQ